MYFFNVTKTDTAVSVKIIENQKYDGKDIPSDVTIVMTKSVKEETSSMDFTASYSPVLSTANIKLVESGAGTGKFKCYMSDVKVLTPASPIAVLDEYKALVGKDIFGKTSLIDDIKAKYSIPTSEKDGYYVSKNDWKLLVRNIIRHKNTMILGPTGCGKTTIVKKVADVLGKKFYKFDMGTMIDPSSNLLGVHRLEDGKSIFDYAKFTKAIQEPCVILLDELNRSSLAANNILFSCLDDSRSLSIDIAGSKDVREIPVHPDCTFVATANIGVEYSGTNTIDRALLDRFFVVEIAAIPDNEEAQVLTKRTGISMDISNKIVKISSNIRSSYASGNLSVRLSIREDLEVASLVSDGWKLGEAIEAVYLNMFEGTLSDGERSIVYKTIKSY